MRCILFMFKMSSIISIHLVAVCNFSFFLNFISGGGQSVESAERRNRAGAGHPVQGLETRGGQVEHDGVQETAGSVK